MSLPYVEAPLRYLEEVPAEKPAVYVRQRVPRDHRRGPQLAPRTRPIYDARELPTAPQLDVEGVALVIDRGSFEAWSDDQALRSGYYPAVEALVREHTGARRVLAFDHNLRSKTLADAGGHDAQLPVHFAHNDYTDESAPQRVRDLLPDEADALLARRFAVVNVWRPIRAPVEATPLAICDAQTLPETDLVSVDLLYPGRSGEIQSVRYDPGHRWLYFPRMRPEEVMLLKCYDSARDGRARFTAHTAFDDPHTPANARARESVEVRTLAFF